MQRIGGQVRSIRPADDPILVDEGLIEDGRIAQRFKHRTEKTIGNRNNSMDPVVERQFETKALERSDCDNSGHPDSFQRSNGIQRVMSFREPPVFEKFVAMLHRPFENERQCPSRNPAFQDSQRFDFNLDRLAAVIRMKCGGGWSS